MGKGKRLLEKQKQENKVTGANTSATEQGRQTTTNVIKSSLLLMFINKDLFNDSHTQSVHSVAATTNPNVRHRAVLAIQI